MGTFNCSMRLASLDGEQTLDVEALVDTGAFYTVVPAAQLDELGVDRTGSIILKFADGRTEPHDLGQAWAFIDGGSVVTRVVFGGDDSTVLLGAYTLEGLSLSVDPVAECLVPVGVHTA